MTELEQVLTGARPAPGSEEEWAAFACARARPALAWLGLASKSGQDEVTGRVLTSSEVRLLCDAMVLRFVLPDGALAWSSYMLDTVAAMIAETVDGPPEALFRSFWDHLAERELDKNVYEFCRALGTQVRPRYGAGSRWDLRWMMSSTWPSHACLRGWILGVRPELWAEVEGANEQILRGYEFR